MDRRRAVVTGMGVIACNGIGVKDFWSANLAGKSGVKAVTAFDTSMFTARTAGSVDDFDVLGFLDKRDARRLDRFSHFGVAASKMALEDSGLDLESEDRERIGSIIGSGLGGVIFHEEQILAGYEKGVHRLNPLCVPRITPNAVSAQVGIYHGLLGPNMVVSTACASGTHAIGEALRKIQYGEADVVFTGGVEAPLTHFTFGAYCAMKVLSKRNDPPEKASRPFDRDRDGFVLAEGGAVLILEEREHALRRGAHIHAELTGYGLSSGAYNIVIPDPTGHDTARAMHLAIRDAAVAPDGVDYINAHATATGANDAAETKGIKEVFGDRAWQVPISATKSMTGHAIGAAGAIEAVVCCMAIQDQMIPPTINLDTPDPECDLDYVANVARAGKVGVVLSNSFGFGNANACLVFARHAT